MCNKHCPKFNYLISEDLRKYLLSFSSVEFGICLGVSCGDIIMRCYRLGILVQKIVESCYLGILLPTWNLGTGWVWNAFQVSGVDVLMYAVLLK